MFCIDCGSNSLSIDGIQDTSDEIVTPHLSARPWSRFVGAW